MDQFTQATGPSAEQVFEVGSLTWRLGRPSLMPEGGSRRGPTSHANEADDALRVDDDASTAADKVLSNEWSVLDRPRRSRRQYVRQIVIDVLIVAAAAVIIALLA